DRLDLRGGDRELAIGAVAEARRLASRLAPLLDSASGIYFALERSSAEEALAAAALSPEVEGAVVAHLNRLSRVRPALGGDDLIRMGIPPGPAHGRILREILAARLDGIVKTPEEEAEMARRLAGFSDDAKQREIQRLQQRLSELRREIYSRLTPWQKTLVARHPRRPYTLDYIQHLCTDFVEVHGDRKFADDPAIVAGFAFFLGH